MRGHPSGLPSPCGNRNEQRRLGGCRWTALLEVVVVFGVWVGVVWYCFCYNPQFTVGNSLPRGHHIYGQIRADMNGDGRREVLAASGANFPEDEDAIAATISAFHWQRWHWKKVWGFADPVSSPSGNEYTVPGGEGEGSAEHEPLQLEDIDGDGLPEIVFRSVRHGGSDSWTCLHIFGYRDGWYRSFLPASPWHAMQGGFEIMDLDRKRQGREILVWTFLWEDHNHYAPHRYYATFLAWDGKRYTPYRWVESKRELQGRHTVLRALLNPSAVIVRSKPRSEDEM
ncbi:MAG: VCBS repeat-containing protein [Armatimonadetes bacterium]|nr:VCBS repeat-containing protein [Armatimonadota bacterium]